MLKTRPFIAVIAGATLALSTVASAAGFASWDNARHAGRHFAYWGRHGVHVGHWYRGAEGWYPGKFGGWYPGKFAGAGVYYACPGCYHGDYYGHHHDNDDLLWYGLGVATVLLGEKPRHAVVAGSGMSPPGFNPSQTVPVDCAVFAAAPAGASHRALCRRPVRLRQGNSEAAGDGEARSAGL